MQNAVTLLIYAGGRATRMGGINKALVPFLGRPMVEWVRERLAKGVSQVLLSANRDHETFEGMGFVVCADTMDEYPGPLAGLLAVKERERPMIVLDLPSPVQLWPGSILRQEMCLVGGSMDDVRQLHMYDVVGCGPSLRDRISDRQILPSVKAGDLIALLDVGVHAPNPVLPEFLWSGGELFRLTDEPPFRVTAW